MRLPKRQYTVGMLFPTPQMANMEKLKQEKCVGVHNTELVTDSQTHVALEAHKIVTLTWTHCARSVNRGKTPKLKGRKIKLSENDPFGLM